MDTKKFRDKIKGTSGLLSLEGSIALTIFIFLMLFLYSFLVFFEARNEIAHVLLTTTDSLALDSFAGEMADDNSLQGLVFKLYSNARPSNGTYTEGSKWYDSGNDTVQDTIRTRFLAYISGSDENEANKILNSLHVVGGMNGLDFSGSYVENGELHVKVRYTIEYEFNMFGFDSVELEQSACSKMWNFSGGKGN